MENTSIIVYTMKGCPFCEQFKETLVKENIFFVDRDIHENEDEYNLFVKATGNELIPSLLIIEDTNTRNPKSYLYSPEKNYESLDEALVIVKKHLEVL